MCDKLIDDLMKFVKNLKDRIGKNADGYDEWTNGFNYACLLFAKELKRRSKLLKEMTESISRAREAIVKATQKLRDANPSDL